MPVVYLAPGPFGAGGQFFGLGGLPLNLGTITTYAAGSTTPLATYTTSAGSVQNANPIVLGTDGRPPNEIWVTSDFYRFDLKDSLGNLIKTYDNLGGAYVDAASLASTASPTLGDYLVGDKGTTTGEVATTVGAYLNLRVKGLKKSFGCAADDSTDDTTKINTAFASGKIIEAEDGTYKFTSTLLVPASQKVYGYGDANTIFKCYADVVGLRLTGSHAEIREFKVIKSGAHTSNLVEVGSASLQAGNACVLDGIWVEGAGSNGIAIRNGNIGTIRNVTSLSNGNDGIQFTTETINTNAWTIDGYNDLRSNTRDGLNFASGSSQADAFAGKSNFAQVVVQSNGRYGVYSGTRSNVIEMYGESNTTKDLFLDTFAYGNKVILVEGAYTDNGTGNEISYHNMNATYTRGAVSKQYFSGATGAGWRVWNDDGTSGLIDFHKTGAGLFEFLADGFSSDQTLTVKHNDPTYRLNLSVTGFISATNGRLRQAQGAAVTAANNMTLGLDGNYFPISGATQINLIETNNWIGGCVAILRFSSNPVVKHNQASSGSFRPIQLVGAVDFSATANDTLTLVFDSSVNSWCEVARSVI